MPESLHIPWKADDPLVTITVSEPDVLSVRMFGVEYPALRCTPDSGQSASSFLPW